MIIFYDNDFQWEYFFPVKKGVGVLRRPSVNFSKL